MLVISGPRFLNRETPPSIIVSISQSRCLSFQGLATLAARRETLKMFQSRNRDAFHFRFSHMILIAIAIHLFQSRNRDAFHFRSSAFGKMSCLLAFCFNLVIEMLFISGVRVRVPVLWISGEFQSRNRDAFHFRQHHAASTVTAAVVSIS